MNTFFKPVEGLAGTEQLNKCLSGEKTAMISGCIDTQKVHMAQTLSKDYRYNVIVTYDEAKAREMCEDAAFFNKNTVYYPAKDIIFYSADVHGNQIVAERLRCINKIIENENASQEEENHLTVVTTIDAFADMLIPVDVYKEACININKRSIINIDDFVKQMVTLGYERIKMSL